MSQMQSISDLMAEAPLLDGMDQTSFDLLAGCAQNVHYGEDQLVLTEGGPADHFYLIRKGNVFVEVDLPGRGGVVLEALGPGDVLGVSWLIPPYKNTFDARAGGEVSAIRFDAVCIRTKCDADPALGYSMYQRFSGVIRQRLQSARIRLLDLYSLNVD
ncbi:MAG: cyclic nucleotide-binding domain-containing protein [Actinomycetia bacterium]|nr:cyclic nucleotide-binding domain-containing protein [Actinomycetes bacterium]MCP4962157.1 cyclic nucleotide-binding domain-containing protein [Actinomycetes bacterium]